MSIQSTRSKVWAVLVHAWDECPFYQSVFVASETPEIAAQLAVDFVGSQPSAQKASADPALVNEVYPPRTQRNPIAEFWPEIYFVSGRAIY